jgi:hypothetical protein
LHDCDVDRQFLSNLDNDRGFRELMQDANRANASFYTIDPRGLPVFDTPIGPKRPPPPHVDQAMLRHRIDALRTLAENTDGMAAVNHNDLDRSLKRITDDLTSYYLLGYYSSNPKLDGSFRSIKVQVARPGVAIRARRGYRAATAEEVAAARKAAEAVVPESVAAVTRALGALARLRPDAPLHLHAVPVPASSPALWVAGEIAPPAAEAEAWREGGEVQVVVSTGAAGETVATAASSVPAGLRSFLVKLPLSAAADDLTVRVRVNPARPGALPVTGVVAPSASGALVYRRGPATANRYRPAADFRFRHTDRVRLEIPATPGTKAGEGRVLDQKGQALAIPVSVSERDQDGVHWIVADVTLAPLSQGDYLIEVVASTEGGEHRVLAPVRVQR